jgi:hypothetical protein
MNGTIAMDGTNGAASTTDSGGGAGEIISSRI